MKLLNLDVDDLYLLSKPMLGTTPSGLQAQLLALDLGSPIYRGLCNRMYFGGKHGWNVSEGSDLLENRYGMQLGFNAPTVWDVGAKGKGSNLLFTGVYSKDCSHLSSQTHLRCKDYSLLNKVKLVAGGYKPLATGGTWVNLVLVVPSELHYVINNVAYSCKTGSRVGDSLGFDVAIDNVFRHAEVI